MDIESKRIVGNGNSTELGNTYTIKRVMNGYLMFYRGSRWVFKTSEEMFTFINNEEDESNGNK